MEICGDNRFEIIAKAKADLLESTNIDTSPNEMAVIDNILFRCWQMGWLDRYDRKTEPTETTDYCKICNHKGCETCAADGSNPYCVPSRYEPQIVGKHADVIIIDEPQTCNDCDQQRCETCVTEIGKDEPQTETTTGTDCSWK